MTVHEIAEKTGLTKKAITYYEKVGLLTPKYDPENGYRVFADEDFRRLATIALLRQLDFPIARIRPVLEGKMPIDELMHLRLQTIHAEVESLEAEKKIIAAFLDQRRNNRVGDAVPEDVIELKTEIELNQFSRQNCIRAQWQRIFPGSLGRLFSLLYNAFLNEPVDTPEKRQAWAAFVEQLDQIEEIDIPEDIRLILDSEMFGSHLLSLENDYEPGILQLSGMDRKRLQQQMPTPPAMGIEELPPENIELVRSLLRISAFVREELGERLAPLKKHLMILSTSYGAAAQNLSFMIEAIHQRADYKPHLELFERLRAEVAH